MHKTRQRFLHVQPKKRKKKNVKNIPNRMESTYITIVITIIKHKKNYTQYDYLLLFYNILTNDYHCCYYHLPSRPFMDDYAKHIRQPHSQIAYNFSECKPNAKKIAKIHKMMANKSIFTKKTTTTIHNTDCGTNWAQRYAVKRNKKRSNCFNSTRLMQKAQRKELFLMIKIKNSHFFLCASEQINENDMKTSWKLRIHVTVAPGCHT